MSWAWRSRPVVVLLVPAGEPLVVAVDDSVFRRSGRRMFGAAGQHDGSSPARNKLSFGVTWTARLPKNAVLFALAPPRVRKPGRPPREGPRLGTPADLAAAAWTRATVRIYGRDQGEDLAEITCLWYGCLDVIPVRVILARDQDTTLALVTTDPAASAAALIERYAARWGIEQAFADARTVLGAGEARTRARRAVQRTVPFALLVHTLVITWYARHGPTRPASPPAAPPSPGTGPGPSPPSRTCSPSSAAS